MAGASEAALMMPAKATAAMLVNLNIVLSCL
jgi:hypothetical protein